MVYRLDPCREARVVAALGRLGAPVPAVLAVDTGTRAMGRPCFVMDCVDGRSVPDAAPAGYHGPGWFRDAGARGQRAVWDSFHDALGAVHGIDPTFLADEYDGPSGAVDVLGYWRDALLDVVTAEQAPRQVAMFDWLAANIPPSAEEPPALCMGDARLVNGVVATVAGPRVGRLRGRLRRQSRRRRRIQLVPRTDARGRDDTRLPGVPPEQETWVRWSRATGRALVDLDYWMAFGATVIVVTATRAMVQWGLVDPFAEELNALVSAWESVVDRAAS